MAGLGGKREGAGRPKGVRNKITNDVKEMVLGALSDIGGQKWLADTALEHPVAFLGLIGKILPLQLTGQNGGPVAIDFRWAEPEPSDKPEAATLTIEAELEDEAVIVTFTEPTP